MIVGCGVFGYSISNIGQIFSDMFELENIIKEKLLAINIYMMNKKIPFEL